MQLKLVFQAFSALFLFLLAYVFTENLNIVLIENWLWKQESLCLIRLHSHVVNRTKGTKLVEYFKTQQFASIPLAHSTCMEESYENIKLLLSKKQYSISV